MEKKVKGKNISFVEEDIGKIQGCDNEDIYYI